MKLSVVPLFALLSIIVPAQFSLASPAPPLPEPTTCSGVKPHELVKRNAGTVQIDNLQVRSCPRTSCGVLSTLSKGATVNVVCYTRVNTTPVNGDYGWGILGGRLRTNTEWVPLAWGQYVSWTGSLPPCP